MNWCDGKANCRVGQNRHDKTPIPQFLRGGREWRVSWVLGLPRIDMPTVSAPPQRHRGAVEVLQGCMAGDPAILALVPSSLSPVSTLITVATQPRVRCPAAKSATPYGGGHELVCRLQRSENPLLGSPGSLGLGTWAARIETWDSSSSFGNPVRPNNQRTSTGAHHVFLFVPLPLSPVAAGWMWSPVLAIDFLVPWV
jgi:hypothetical protein